MKVSNSLLYISLLPPCVPLYICLNNSPNTSIAQPLKSANHIFTNHKHTNTKKYKCARSQIIDISCEMTAKTKSLCFAYKALH